SEKALVDMTVTDRDGSPFKVSWPRLSTIVDAMAIGLRAAGMRPGVRVSMLVEPDRGLTAALYAVLRAGGGAVVTDAALGGGGMTRAITTAAPQWIIGEVPGLTLARLANLPGKRLSVQTMGPIARRSLGLTGSLYSFATTYAGQKYQPMASHPHPEPSDDAAI